MTHNNWATATPWKINPFPLNYYLGDSIKLRCHWPPQKYAAFWTSAAGSEGTFSFVTWILGRDREQVPGACQLTSAGSEEVAGAKQVMCLYCSLPAFQVSISYYLNAFENLSVITLPSRNTSSELTSAAFPIWWLLYRTCFVFLIKAVTFHGGGGCHAVSRSGRLNTSQEWNLLNWLLWKGQHIFYLSCSLAPNSLISFSFLYRLFLWVCLKIIANLLTRIAFLSNHSVQGAEGV